MATGLFGHARLSRHVLAGLFAPQSATLVVLLGGSGRITFHTLLGPHGHMSNVRSNQMLAPYDQQLTADIYRITARRVAHLAVLLERAQFWQEPAERQSRDIALYRAECLFEGGRAALTTSPSLASRSQKRKVICGISTKVVRSIWP